MLRSLFAPSKVSIEGATISPEGKKTRSTVLGNVIRVFWRMGLPAATGSILAASMVSVWSSATIMQQLPASTSGGATRSRSSSGWASLGSVAVSPDVSEGAAVLFSDDGASSAIPTCAGVSTTSSFGWPLVSPDMGEAIPTAPVPLQDIWRSAGSARMRCTSCVWASMSMGSGFDPCVTLSEPFRVWLWLFWPSMPPAKNSKGAFPVAMASVPTLVSCSDAV